MVFILQQLAIVIVNHIPLHVDGLNATAIHGGTLYSIYAKRSFG